MHLSLLSASYYLLFGGCYDSIGGYMLQIRNNIFETNSSSTHSFTVSRILDNIEDVRRKMQILMDDRDTYYAEKLLDSLCDLVKEYDNVEE